MRPNPRREGHDVRDPRGTRRHGWRCDSRGAARRVAARRLSPRGAGHLREYGDAWLAQRDLEQTTRGHYAQLLRDHVYPAPTASRGRRPPPRLARWARAHWHDTAAGGPDDRPDHPSPRLRAAAHHPRHRRRDELIPRNPCHIRGAGNAKRVQKIKPATLAELEAIVDGDARAVPADGRCWPPGAPCGSASWPSCAAATSTPKDGVVHVRRGVVRADGETIVEAPEDRRRHPRRGDPAAPDAAGQGAPARARRAGQGRAAVPGRGRRPPGPVDAVQGLLPGPRGGRPARPAVPRPAAHRRRAGRLRPAPRWPS